MRLHLLRDCYYTKDKGKTWIKKKTFNTEEEARAKGLNYTNWHLYTCPSCFKVHGHRIGKKSRESG